MKKIYILTRHRVVNYGSLFQSEATQTLFDSIGFDNFIIDYIPDEEKLFKDTLFSVQSKNNFFKFLLFILKLFDNIIKRTFFRKFRKKNLKMVKYGYPINNNILCSGSDQLWGYMPNGKLNKEYFLCKSKNEKFAMSSSFGRTNFKEIEVEFIISALKEFSFISVREKSAETFLSNNNIISTNILDPTLLVPREYWLLRAKNIKNKNYILLYQLTLNKELFSYAKQLSKQTKKRVIVVSTSIYSIFSGNKVKLLKSPEYVLGLFKNADFIVSRSFHASVFAIIFNKPFTTFIPNGTGSRIKDLCKTLGLRNNIVNFGDSFKIPNLVYDYKLVNDKISKLRNDNIEYLKVNIEKL